LRRQILSLVRQPVSPHPLKTKPGYGLASLKQHSRLFEVPASPGLQLRAAKII